MTDKEFLDLFKNEVCLKHKTLNEEEQAIMDDVHWDDMSIGFFLAKGASVTKAAELASKARYKLQYWEGE